MNWIEQPRIFENNEGYRERRFVLQISDKVDLYLFDAGAATVGADIGWHSWEVWFEYKDHPDHIHTCAVAFYGADKRYDLEFAKSYAFSDAQNLVLLEENYLKEIREAMDHMVS